MKGSEDNQNKSLLSIKLTQVKRFIIEKASNIKNINIEIPKDKFKGFRKLNFNKSVLNARTGIIAIVAILFLTFSVVKFYQHQKK